MIENKEQMAKFFYKINTFAHNASVTGEISPSDAVTVFAAIIGIQIQNIDSIEDRVRARDHMVHVIDLSIGINVEAG